MTDLPGKTLSMQKKKGGISQKNTTLENLSFFPTFRREKKNIIFFHTQKLRVKIKRILWFYLLFTKLREKLR